MQEISNIRELKKKQYLLYVCIMIFFFLVMFTYTLVWCIQYNKTYGFFVKTEATVVEHNSEEGKMYDVLEYEVDNVVIHNTSSYISKNNIGDKITIYYDSNNPSGFITKLDNRRIVLPIITASYGVVCTVLSIMFFTTYYGKSSTMQFEKKSENIGKSRSRKKIRIDATKKESVSSKLSKKNINAKEYMQLKTQNKETNKTIKSE